MAAIRSDSVTVDAHHSKLTGREGIPCNWRWVCPARRTNSAGDVSAPRLLLAINKFRVVGGWRPDRGQSLQASRSATVKKIILSIIAMSLALTAQERSPTL